MHQTLRLRKGYAFNGFSNPRIAWTPTGMHPYRPDLCRGGLAHDGLFQAQPPGWTPSLARAELLAILAQDGVRAEDLAETDIGLMLGEDKVWAANAEPALVAAARQFVSLS